MSPVQTAGIWSVAGLAAILGASFDKVFDYGKQFYDIYIEGRSRDYNKKRENLHEIISYWKESDGLEKNLLFTSLYIKGGLIEEDNYCTVIAYAQHFGDFQRAQLVLSSIFDEDEKRKYFAKPLCNIASYAPTAANKGDAGVEPSSVEERIQSDAAVPCPAGTLFTQFGKQESVDFGKRLAQLSVTNATINLPEYIPGFDAKNVVVRYFHSQDEATALAWHDYFQLAWPDIDFKYARLSGYESKIGPKRFELWWPASVPVPDSTDKLKCGTQPPKM